MAAHKKSAVHSRQGQWVARTCVVAVLVAGIGGFVSIQEGSSNPAPAKAPALAADSAPSLYRSQVASRSDAVGRAPLVTKTVTLTVDGQARKLATTATDVRTALQQVGVVLAKNDVVAPDLDSALAEGDEIVVGTPTTKVVTLTETDKYTTKKQNDGNLMKGTTRVAQRGANGESVTTYSVDMLGEAEISRTVVARSVTRERVDEVVHVGTAKSAGPTSPVAAGTSRAIAKELAAARGWGADQFSCLDNLWQRESGWRTTAGNPISGAYGIPQSLPGSKMASAGADWRTNPTTQITWGLGYIKGRYSTPCGAWAHFQIKNWY